MAAGVSWERLKRRKRYLERKHGRQYTILRASNGESAILPACRTCGKANPPWLPACHSEDKQS